MKLLALYVSEKESKGKRTKERKGMENQTNEMEKKCPSWDSNPHLLLSGQMS